MNVKRIEEEMQLKQLKIELIQLLLNSDELGLLQKLRQELFTNKKTPKEDEIVGYSSTGEPISKKEMEKKLIESIKQIEKGEFIDLEDLEQESKNW